MLRFRNAGTGYVRSYRVSTAKNESQDVSSGLNACPEYTQEYTTHLLERTDSTGSAENKRLKFDVFATTNATRLKATLTIGSTTFELPLQEVEDGTQVLAPATFAGRTYPAVLGATSSVAFAGPTVSTTMYLTKADGLVRFEERGGTVWNRL